MCTGFKRIRQSDRGSQPLQGGVGEDGDVTIDQVIAALTAQPFHSYADVAARSPTAAPKAHGLYAWWQTPGALPGVPGTPHPTDAAFELLYVGTAPKDAISKSNLRKRLGNHHRSAIGSSTFRLDLAAFLWEREGWQPCWTDRPKLPDADLAELGLWQSAHLRVQRVERSQPWDIEKRVVHAMRPPLNRDHNDYHPAYSVVGDARDTIRAAARSHPC